MLETSGKGGKWTEGDVQTAQEYGGGGGVGEEVLGRWKEVEWALGEVPIHAPPVAVRA
jgi:hypothetical protein